MYIDVTFESFGGVLHTLISNSLGGGAAVRYVRSDTRSPKQIEKRKLCYL